MNETVMQATAAVGSVAIETHRKPEKRRSNSVRGYSLVILTICFGWVLRERELIDPAAGLGYWLGIIGGSMMLVLLLYPLRKRIRVLRLLGPTSHWFRIHMFLGVLGPLLILYHCNFQLGSFNSKVALYCMLLVAGSGVIGRHFYARIHRGLYGRKTSLAELQSDLTASLEKSHGLAALTPQLVSKLERMSSELQGDAITRTLGVGRSLQWMIKKYVVRISLILTARRELRAQAMTSTVVQQDHKRLRKAASKYVSDYVGLMGRIAQFSFYERLFSLWHVFHLPLFFIMVLTALLHVLAVHMY